MTEETGAQGQEAFANGADNLPQVAIISQYVKDLSFENPNSPAVYQWQTQPQIGVDFNIGAAKLNDEIHEVSLRIEVKASADGQTAFAMRMDVRTISAPTPRQGPSATKSSGRRVARQTSRIPHSVFTLCPRKWPFPAEIASTRYGRYHGISTASDKKRRRTRG